MGVLQMSVRDLVLQVGEHEQLVLPPFKLAAKPQETASVRFRLDGGEGETIVTSITFQPGTHLKWFNGHGKTFAYTLEDSPTVEIPYKRGCKAVEIEAVNVMEWSAK